MICSFFCHETSRVKFGFGVNLSWDLCGVLERRGTNSLPIPIKIILGIPRLYHIQTETCDFWTGQNLNSIDMSWQKHKEPCTWMFHDKSKVTLRWMIPVAKGFSTRNCRMIGGRPEKTAAMKVVGQGGSPVLSQVVLLRVAAWSMYQ